MTKIIVANWKMCGSPESAKLWAVSFLPALSKLKTANKIIVCPPAPLISQLKNELTGSIVKIGAQNCHFQPEDAYTGEICASLLKACGCEYVIVGHSERRSYFNETNEIVRRKAARAIKIGLTPIICIGESEEQKNSGKTIEVINQQLAESIPSEAKSGDFIVAYEPVWAIGSGKIPSLEEIKQVHQAILTNISSSMAIDIKKISVLYGGSVKADNAKDIMAMPEVSGVLVGGASLKADEFVKIVAGG